jgi:hypothetical protein
VLIEEILLVIVRLGSRVVVCPACQFQVISPRKAAAEFVMAAMHNRTSLVAAGRPWWG